MMKDLRRWLKSRSADKGPLRFLLRLLLRSAVGAGPLEMENRDDGVEKGFDQVTLKDEARLRLLATCDLETTVTYRELLAPLSPLTRPATDDEVKLAMEHVSWLQREAPRVFPLELYWRTVRPGVWQSAGWLHLGSGSLQPGLDLFLPSSGEPHSSEDLTMNFVLYCSQNSVPSEW